VGVGISRGRVNGSTLDRYRGAHAAVVILFQRPGETGKRRNGATVFDNQQAICQQFSPVLGSVGATEATSELRRMFCSCRDPACFRDEKILRDRVVRFNEQGADHHQCPFPKGVAQYSGESDESEAS
jgi:hypothetical protein